MAIAKVADRANINGSSVVSTVDLVLTGMTVGNTLIIRAAADNSGTNGAARTMTVTNQSGTPINVSTDLQYTQLNDPGVASAGLCIYVVVAAITATSGTVRLTYSGTVMQAAQAEEWSGIDTAAPVVGSPVGGTSITSTLATVTDASVAAGNMAYVALGFEGPATYTYTEDSDSTNGTWVGLTKRSSANATALSNQTIAGAYKLVTATGGQTYNPASVLSTVTDSAALIIEFAAAPVAKVGSEALSISLTEGAADVVKTTVEVILSEDFEDTNYNISIASGAWLRTSSQFHGGAWSFTNDNITDSQTTDLVVNVPEGATEIKFWYRVSSELSWDWFRFFVDASQKSQFSGTVAWTQASWDVTGATTVTFRYTKDSSGDVGEDSAYIDDIEFIGPAVDSVPITGTNDPLNISLTEGAAAVLHALPQTLVPTAIGTQTNITGTVGDIDEDPDSPDGNWMIGTGSSVLRVTFPTPDSDLVAGFSQEFKILLRPGI